MLWKKEMFSVNLSDDPYRNYGNSSIGFYPSNKTTGATVEQEQLTISGHSN